MKLDAARPVRPGEELDLSRLSPYLEQHGMPGPHTVQQFPGGYSNLTFLINDRWVLRRPPRGANVKGGHDMGREYRILSALYPVYPKVPRPLVNCEEEEILGAPFYLMERVRGVILRGAGDASCTPELMEKLSRTLIELQAQLHGLKLDLGKAEGYVERQVTGWIGRWHKAEGKDGDEVTDWLAANQPQTQPACLIHNDFKYDNLVLDPDDPTQVLAILDWEMATMGDPWMDLGTTLGYWIDPDDPPELQQLGFGPTFRQGNLNRRQLIEHYQSLRGACPGNIDFYYVFGLFKVAVIGQQIYARYARGLTHDSRFAHLDKAVALLLRQARRHLS